MRLGDNFKLAAGTLYANKRRTLLTSLGIIIGIAAIIIVMSVGAGAQSLIINQLNSVGTNLIGILPGASDENGPPASVLGIVVRTLTYQDAVAIGQQVPNVAAVSSYNTGIGNISYQNQSTNATFYGVMAEYPQVEEVELMGGRFFTAEEERSGARLAVIGYQVWNDLFQGADPVGQKIKIKKETFEIIGALTERGTAGFQNQDNVVFVPAQTAQKLLLGVNHANFIRVKATDPAVVDQVTNDVRLLLRDRHRITNGEPEDFSVRNTQDAIDILTNITNAMKFFLVAIAMISLLVGGVGVMNIMLASVTERIREIGLRKAVGARRSDIIRQFLIEAVAITVSGGAIGIIIGSLVAVIVAVIAWSLDYDWDLVVSPWSIILGLAMAGSVGIIFGVYPARRAARLDPITALRYE